MKHTKRLLALMLMMVMVLSLAACAGQSAQPVDIKIATLKGPTGMGMAKLMEDASVESAQGDHYEFSLAAAPDEITAQVVNGSVDIAAVPTNLASVLYQKTEGQIQVAALNTLGVLYLLENGESIQSVADLKGKTIGATGQGSTPEYVLDYILTKNGLDPEKDVTIVWKGEHSELAALMSAGEVEIGMLPEPNVTAVLSANSGVRSALNLTEEWNKVAGEDSTLTMGCIVVQKKFAEEHKDALNRFLKAYSESVEYVNTNLDEASQLVEKHGILPKAAVAKKAIPNCNITYVDGAPMKTSLSGFLKVLFDANPASIGGAMPDDAFYYAK